MMISEETRKWLKSGEIQLVKKLPIKNVFPYLKGKDEVLVNVLIENGIKTIEDLISIDKEKLISMFNENEDFKLYGVVDDYLSIIKKLVHTLGFQLNCEDKVELANVKISSLGFPKRVENALERKGISYLIRLLDFDSEQIKCLRNVGPGSMLVLNSILSDLGYHLKDVVNKKYIDDKQLKRQEAINENLLRRINKQKELVESYKRLEEENVLLYCSLQKIESELDSIYEIHRRGNK